SSGGGIGGLTLASSLAWFDKGKRIDVDIYEAADVLEEIGAGIHIWPRAWNLLKGIGLEEDMIKVLPDQTKPEETALVFQFRKSDQPSGQSIYDMYAKGGMVRVHRADLQRILMKHASAACKLHLSSRLVSCTEKDDGVHLLFEDGSTKTCDLLVGADGIKSTVRRLFLERQPPEQGHGESIEPVWSGTYAYRGLVPKTLLDEKLPGHRASQVPVMYCGKSKHIVVYPVSHGKLINVVACAHDRTKEETPYDGVSVLQVTHEEMLSKFDNWEPEVRALLECIPRPSRWAIQNLRPLKVYGKGRVLLLGDAAHAMTPHQGAGAGQAMEDAYTLAYVLSHSDIVKSTAQMPLVTHVYNAIRQPFGNNVLDTSRICGRLSGLTDPDKQFPEINEGDDTVPHEVLEGIILKMEGLWKWLWDSSVEDRCEEASSMLRRIHGSANSEYVKSKL
ncbi:hypothetical protein AMATHDRAFT_142975, partial [Amanita thiersii Skay4041]